MKPFMVIKEPEAYALLADETRRKILYLLRVKEMTVSQIAAEMGVTSQAIYHHIKKLLKGKMVEVAREERVGHLIESYYIATAEDFLLSHGKIKSESLRDRKNLEEQVTAALKALRSLGFDLELEEKSISQIVDMKVAINECCKSNPKIEDAIWNKDELDIPSKMMAAGFVKTLSMSDSEFNREQEDVKKIRGLLLSLVKKKTHAPIVSQIVE